MTWSRQGGRTCLNGGSNLSKRASLMPHTRYSGEEIARRGEEIYETRLRGQVETEENIGKIISIDIETGDYEIADDPLITGRRLQAKHADAAIYGKRIGYKAVFAIGSALARTAE